MKIKSFMYAIIAQMFFCALAFSQSTYYVATGVDVANSSQPIVSIGQYNDSTGVSSETSAISISGPNANLQNIDRINKEVFTLAIGSTAVTVNIIDLNNETLLGTYVHTFPAPSGGVFPNTQYDFRVIPIDSSYFGFAYEVIQGNFGLGSGGFIYLDLIDRSTMTVASTTLVHAEVQGWNPTNSDVSIGGIYSSVNGILYVVFGSIQGGAYYEDLTVKEYSVSGSTLTLQLTTPLIPSGWLTTDQGLMRWTDLDIIPASVTDTIIMYGLTLGSGNTYKVPIIYYTGGTVVATPELNGDYSSVTDPKYSFNTTMALAPLNGSSVVGGGMVYDMITNGFYSGPFATPMGSTDNIEDCGWLGNTFYAIFMRDSSNVTKLSRVDQYGNLSTYTVTTVVGTSDSFTSGRFMPITYLSGGNRVPGSFDFTNGVVIAASSNNNLIQNELWSFIK